MKLKNIILFALFFCLNIPTSFSQTLSYQWGKNMGSTSNDVGHPMAVDAAGNVYTTGYYTGTVDFDPGAGTTNLTAVGSHDVFISKLDATGNFIWAKSMGGNGPDYGYGIALDAAGNVYTTGYFEYTADFDPSSATSNLTTAGSADIFISKLDNNGNFVWAKSMGSVDSDYGLSIDVDASGNVYTTGSFDGTVDFDPGAASSNLTSGGTSSDIFISKFDANGNFVWAKSMGGTGDDMGWGIILDAAGNVYTTGYFSGTMDADPNGGVSNLTTSGTNDIFVSKLDASGNFVWGKNMGGTGYDEGRCLAIDPSGNIYLSGWFESTADFDPNTGTQNLISNGLKDIFISKLDASGNFVWAKSIGGTGEDRGYAIALNSSGNVYTTGYFKNTVDFDPGAGTHNLTSAGFEDIFICQLDGSGNFVWSNTIGGTGYDRGYSIVIDASNNIYSAGYFENTADFDLGSGTANLTSAGSFDIFIFKMSQSPDNVNEIENDFTATIFPNPASNSITVQTNEAIEKIDVYNLLGELIQTETKNNFSIVPIASGTYIVHIKTAKGNGVARFVKK